MSSEKMYAKFLKSDALRVERERLGYLVDEQIRRIHF
jgi:hypothetical protein